MSVSVNIKLNLTEWCNLPLILNYINLTSNVIILLQLNE